METSRREVLAVAAATITLPMLQSALGTVRSAHAAASAPASSTAPASQEKPGWFTTTLKPADLKDNEFTAVDGHKIVLSRSDKTVLAMTNVCTHKQCAIKTKAGNKTLDCACHGAKFNLDGSVNKAPATKPLAHYAIRVNKDGLIEIDPGTTPAADEKTASLTIS